MTTPTQGYLLQRVSGAIMAPLSVWILLWIIPAVGGIIFGNQQQHHSCIQMIFGSVQSITCITVFMICSMYHSVLGFKSIVNDYISCDIMKKVTNFLIIGGALGVVVFTIVLVLTAHIQLQSPDKQPIIVQGNNNK
jgi:succinate dehydrogenase hydrophobic membrane anchor protein